MLCPVSLRALGHVKNDETMEVELDCWMRQMNLLSVNRLVEIILNCGERYEACAAEQVLSLDSQDSATDILSNLYAAAGKWDSAVDMKRKNRVLNSKKDPGLNGTESEQEVGR
ncbi:hypothetical protein PS2_018294 [Malus domestica]